MTLTAVTNNVERSLVIVADVVLAVAASPALHALNPKIAAVVIGAQHVALVVQGALSKPSAAAGPRQLVVPWKLGEPPPAFVPDSNVQAAPPLDQERTPAQVWADLGISHE